MSTHENGPLLDGWSLPPRCCGTWSAGLVCDVCGRWLSELALPPNIELGCE